MYQSLHVLITAWQDLDESSPELELWSLLTVLLLLHFPAQKDVFCSRRLLKRSVFWWRRLLKTRVDQEKKEYVYMKLIQWAESYPTKMTILTSSIICTCTINPSGRKLSPDKVFTIMIYFNHIIMTLISEKSLIIGDLFNELVIKNPPMNKTKQKLREIQTVASGCF